MLMPMPMPIALMLTMLPTRPRPRLKRLLQPRQKQLLQLKQLLKQRQLLQHKLLKLLLRRSKRLCSKCSQLSPPKLKQL